MARKIRLDFSKVEERSGWKTTNMPEGLHEFKIELVDDRDANDGTKMLTYGLRPTNSKYKTRLFPYYCKQQPNQYFKIRDLFIAAGVLDPKRAKGRAVDLDPDAPIGKIVAAEIRDGSGQYADRSEIDGVYDVSIIDDEDGNEPDDDDEEYDEEEEDEVEEDEEEEDDELREEIEALTLGALRKRAKGLDIDTDGVSKKDLVEMILEEELGLEDEEEDEDEDDLDDDDLDDEELDDEEFEDDEEEEEEPTPKRRTPARKAPAKAPAKRTVKRR